MRNYRKKNSNVQVGPNENHAKSTGGFISQTNDDTCLKSTCIPVRKNSVASIVDGNFVSSTMSKFNTTAGPHNAVKRRCSETFGTRTSLPLARAPDHSSSPKHDLRDRRSVRRKSTSPTVYRHCGSRPALRKLTTRRVSASPNGSHLQHYYTLSPSAIDGSYIDVDIVDATANGPYIDVLASLSNDSTKFDLYGVDKNGYKTITNNGLVDKRRLSLRCSDSTVSDEVKVRDFGYKISTAESSGVHDNCSGPCQDNGRGDALLESQNIESPVKSSTVESEELRDKNSVLIEKLNNNHFVGNTLTDQSKPHCESLDNAPCKVPKTDFPASKISNDTLFSIAELLIPYCSDKSVDDIVRALSLARSNYKNNQIAALNTEVSDALAKDNSFENNKVSFDFFKKKTASRNKFSPYPSPNSDCVLKRNCDSSKLSNSEVSRLSNGSYPQNASIFHSATQSQPIIRSNNLPRAKRVHCIRSSRYNPSVKPLRFDDKVSLELSDNPGDTPKKKIETQVWDNIGTITILVDRAIGQGSFARVYPARLTLTKNSLDTSEASTAIQSNDSSNPFQICLQCINRDYLECALKRMSTYNTNRRMQYIREREMMRHLNPHVIRPLLCKIVPSDSKNFQILMPRARGDLASMLKSLYAFRANILFLHYTQQKRNGIEVPFENFRIGLTEREVKFLILQILSGYAFLQTAFQGNMIRHTDIKLANVLVFCSLSDKFNPLKWNVKLADFGSSLLLHPTQHFTENESLLQLTNALITEWISESSNQIQSLVQGTIRFNAPEALTHDRHGSHRSNHNQNLIRAYESLYGSLGKTISEYNQAPRVWGVVEKVDTDGRYPTSTPFVPGAGTHDIAEYSLVDSRADMWSIGVLLADLIRGASTESSLPLIYPTCLTELEYNSPCRSVLSRRAKRLGDSLGTGLFAVRDGKSDKEMSKTMALELNKCNGTRSKIGAYIKSLYSESDLPLFDRVFWDLFISFFFHKPHKRIVAADALGHAWFCGPECPLFSNSSVSSNNCNDLSYFQLIDSLQTHLNHNILEHSIRNASSNSPLSNAWFSGAWQYHTLCHSGEFDPSNPLHLLFKKEAGVLESREKVFWGKTGAVLSTLIGLKDSQICDMTCTLASHVVGHSLLQYKL